MIDIDFVITWVDGGDLEWVKEKDKYLSLENETYFINNGTTRFRDWGNLQYFFRGVEKFAPWVRRVYFVTYGKTPAWLNINNPKLIVVNQNEFIPSEYLPTFNIHTIEHHLYKIYGLSDYFVYFNDDMFLIRDTKQTDFFRKGLPVDTGILTVHCYSRKAHTGFGKQATAGVICDHFEFKQTLRKNFFKWFNPLYGKGLLQNIVLYNCPRFPGFEQHHLPTPLLKNTYYEVWEAEREQLEITCSHKLRHATDLNQWVYRNWQLASGKFIPRKKGLGKSFVINQHQKEIEEYLSKKRGKVICINDSLLDNEVDEATFVYYQKLVIELLNSILPEKSSFEI